VEVQGTGERWTFGSEELDELLALARDGVRQLDALQQQALGI
jgi:ribonuclease PH